MNVRKLLCFSVICMMGASALKCPNLEGDLVRCTKRPKSCVNVTTGWTRKYKLSHESYTFTCKKLWLQRFVINVIAYQQQKIISFQSSVADATGTSRSRGTPATIPTGASPPTPSQKGHKSAWAAFKKTSFRQLPSPEASLRPWSLDSWLLASCSFRLFKSCVMKK